MKFQRRQLLQAFASLPVLHYLSGCTPKDNDNTNTNVDAKVNAEVLPTMGMKTGFLSIIQGPTTDQQSLINIFTPRLKAYTYEVSDETGTLLTVEKYETVKGPFFYNIEKIKVSGLAPAKKYKLQILDVSASGTRSLVDERSFQSLDLTKSNPNFALISCMADDYRFNDVIDPMWNKVKAEDVDFLAITGDVVYVDDKNLVERQKATEMDIWQRYTDTFKRIPLFHWYNLKPIFATWDDHDFGTNDGDRNFIGKDAASKIFKGAFFGPELSSGNTSWTMGPGGTSSLLTAFGQRFFFMDDRSFRQPNKEAALTPEPYGHWGEAQHRWLIDTLKQNDSAAWIVNGNQFFNGAKMTFVESLEQNDPVEFKTFVDELKTIAAPVVFASGDVHLSEIMKISKDVIGYDSYEFTSSSIHSYLGDGWVNPLRVNGAYAIDFNFITFKSSVNNGTMDINAKCVGLPKEPFFNMNFQVSR